MLGRPESTMLRNRVLASILADAQDTVVIFAHVLSAALQFASSSCRPAHYSAQDSRAAQIAYSKIKKNNLLDDLVTGRSALADLQHFSKALWLSTSVTNPYDSSSLN